MLYDTRHDDVFKLKDLTVRSYLELAARIGKKAKNKGKGKGKGRTNEASLFDESDAGEEEDWEDLDMDEVAGEQGQELDQEDMRVEKGDVESLKKKKKKGGKKHKNKGQVNKVWLEFLRRAFSGAVDVRELRDQFNL